MPGSFLLDQRLLPALPGTYALVLRLDRSVVLVAGRLAPATLRPGLFVYVGSARGPGGLRGRVSRHLRANKRAHWHIDALTALAPVTRVWMVESAERRECLWAGALRALPDVTVPIAGFGASDCTCDAHLLALSPGGMAAAWAALGCPAEFILSP
ncbi:MAG: GIY-YIG nuclease family protein [Anaerolineae bacterium]|nr:GIY-YIG nuclease family protein [Anaerolineae bacterium]